MTFLPLTTLIVASDGFVKIKNHKMVKIPLDFMIIVVYDYRYRV